MNLQDWIQTNPETRKKLITEWLYEPDWMRCKPDQFMKILNEAVQSLARQLAHVPQVTGVVGVAGNFGQILVTTSLPRNATLPEIPSEYATFSVLQFGVAEAKKDYLVRVEFALRAARIPDGTVKAQLAFFEQELGSIQSPYYCDSPEKWIAEALAIEITKKRGIGESFVYLRNAIHLALRDFFKESDPSNVGLDPSAISRLEAVLQPILTAV
jgi:hypothetical protein